MNGVIFKNEEDFRLMSLICYKREPEKIEMERAKANGHIRKNSADEAEELYSEWQKKDHAENEDFKIIVKQHEAIQYLKEKLNE